MAQALGALSGAAARGHATIRSTPAPPGRTTSTVWCATTSCAQQPNQADIQVNLLPRTTARRRATTSPSGCVRSCSAIAAPYGARIKVAEVPPGPPVLDTLVAEIYGPDYKGRIEVGAQDARQIFPDTPGVVDVDWYVEDPQTKYDMQVDLDKAALHGVSRRRGDAHAADRTGRRQRRACCTIPQSREDVPIDGSPRRGPTARGIEQLADLKLPTASGRTGFVARSDQHPRRPRSTQASIARTCSRWCT